MLSALKTRWIVCLILCGVAAPAGAAPETPEQALRSLSETVTDLQKGLENDPETASLATPWETVARRVEQVRNEWEKGAPPDQVKQTYRGTVLPAVTEAKRVMYAKKALCYRPAIRPLYHAVRLAVRRTNRRLLGEAVPSEEHTP